MKSFKNALVREPCPNLTQGLSTAGLGRPDYEKALAQHDAYVVALRYCGLEVMVLEADDRFPDSVFIEDTAVVSDKTAIITRPGAPSRQGEEAAVAKALKKFQKHMESITAPGTLEGGDVFKAEDHFYIGVSARTNAEGARQLAAILRKYGYSATPIPLRDVLHLKTGVAYIENNRLLAGGEFLDHPLLAGFEIVPIAADEAYAANSVWINGRVLVPAGFDKTRRTVERLGYEAVPVEVSEFRKLDGGLSCLSLRF
jgi:dimethylargininase